MIVYFGGHARNKTIGNSIFEKALPTLPDYQTTAYTKNRYKKGVQFCTPYIFSLTLLYDKNEL